MEDAHIVGRVGECWAVDCGERRYFFRDSQVVSRRPPHVGMRGKVGYRQGFTALVHTFFGEEGEQ